MPHKDIPAGAPAALAHIRVLDLSRVLAGPSCTQILADLGADVIKVENPHAPDDTRGWGPPFLTGSDGRSGDAAYFLAANRNKRAIAVNFADPEGARIIRDLAAHCDVVVENYKTGGLKKYGLDYAALSAQAPDLIYCSITGFGQTGPLAGEPGYDFLIQAMGGLMSITGEERPVKAGVAVADLFTGVYAAGAVMAALIARERGLGGQHIDMALFDVQAAMLANQAENAFIGGGAPGRTGNAHPNIVPYQDFETADGRIAVAVGSDKQFARFAEAIGHPEWAGDARFARNRDRVAHRGVLVPQIESAMRTQTTAFWTDALGAAGVPRGPVLDVAEVFAHPQAQARGLRVDLAREDGTAAPTPANPMRLSRTPPRYRRAPPAFAADTEAVLGDLLGADAATVAAWRQAGVVA